MPMKMNWESNRVYWLVKNLIPEIQTALILGKPHSMKSWLTEQLAVCVASGTSFLDEFDVIQREVIMYDEDSPTETFKQRMTRLAKGIGKDINELPIEAHSNEGFLLLDPVKRGELIEIVKTKNNPLVIIDSLGAVTKRKDIDKVKEGTGVTSAWSEIRDAGATVIICHHMTLKKESKITDVDVTHLALSSTMLIAGCDTDISVFSITPDEFIVKPHGRRSKLMIKHPFAVRIQEDERQTWAKLQLLEEAPTLPSEPAKSVFLLFLDREDLTVNELAKLVQRGLADNEIRQALKELKTEDVIISDNEAHNRFIYNLNPNFLSDYSLTTSYWEMLKGLF